MPDAVPEFLYRYRHFQGDNRVFVAEILRDSKLFFSSPASFNDPFDCKVHYKTPEPQNLRRAFNDLLKCRFPRATRNQRRRKLNNSLRSIDIDCFAKETINSLQAFVDCCGILSLTTEKDNVLMWSHYACGHTGICLQFSTLLGINFFDVALSISYSKDYLELDMYKNSSEEQVNEFLLTKATDWSYEREWRILDHHGGPGRKDFPANSLTAIIFGARIAESDRKSLKIEPYQP